MRISQRRFSEQDEPLLSQTWAERVAQELARACSALGADGCGWLCDFLSPNTASQAHEQNASLRFVPAGSDRTLIAFNVDISTTLLSSAEMASIIACQATSWTPNLQRWPLTVWSKMPAGQGHGAPLTVCIPLHGPMGTKSIVFLPLADGVKDWYAAALRCVGPLLAAEQELRSVVSCADDQSLVVALTSEELESLSWAAKGKTAWESARIQNISERAVIHRLRRARDKLGASSTAVAAIKAARLGHIERF